MAKEKTVTIDELGGTSGAESRRRMMIAVKEAPQARGNKPRRKKPQSRAMVKGGQSQESETTGKGKWSRRLFPQNTLQDCAQDCSGH